MAKAFEWKPEPTLLEQIAHLAQQQGRSLDAIVTEAVTLYLQNQPEKPSDRLQDDSLSLEQRRTFMKLPLQERRRILQAQSEEMVSHYEQNSEWRELQTGDLFEY
jgi:hypothetical protein